MSRGSACLGLTLAVALLACVLAPGPAVAAQVHTDDGEGDVWQEVYDDHDVFSGWIKAGSPGNADVVSTDARHTLRRITFTTRYATLRRGPGQNRFMTQQRMVFDDGTGASVQLETFRRWTGSSYLYDSRTGNGMRCDGLNHEIDFSADTVLVSLPRACVGGPRWLRYAGAAYSSSGSATEPSEDDHNYFDNALNASHRRGTGEANTSVRIFRG